MLINEVLDSKSIALSATENASNQIPYLGLQWFPERKKQGLDLSWIKTHKGLPVSLAPSNFDTIPTIRARGGLSKEKTQMAFFREGMTVGEEEMLEIERIQSADDPYLASALSSVYDDTNDLVSGAEVVPERMRMSLLATNAGHPVIAIVIPHIKDNYIPIIVGVAGGILGIIGMYVIPDFPANDILNAIAVGIVSGLSSTGVNQIYKQVKNNA